MDLVPLVLQLPHLAPPGELLYRVLYGSHAHGTATPTSDFDWRGVYLLPTNQFLGLGRPQPTWEDKPNDQVFWELGQFCHLLLKGNPNIVGMLWTPEDCIYGSHPYMGELIAARRQFISDATVRAYTAWANQEMKSIRLQGNAIRGIPAKRLSHVPRLLWEVEGAITTGDIPVRLPPEKLEIVRAIKTGDMEYEEAVLFAADLVIQVEDLAERNPMPPPPREGVNNWLVGVRHRHAGV